MLNSREFLIIAECFFEYVLGNLGNAEMRARNPCEIIVVVIAQPGGWAILGNRAVVRSPIIANHPKTMSRALQAALCFDLDRHAVVHD